MTTTPVVAITGAARGIGFAIANAVAASGRAIAVCDVDAAAADVAAAGIDVIKPFVDSTE